MSNWPAYSAGTAYLTISPKLHDQWKQRIRQQVADPKNDPNAKVKVTPELGNLTELRRQLREKTQAWGPTFKVDATLGSVAQLKRELREQTFTAKITPSLGSLADFRRELKEKSQTLPDVKLGVDLDFTRARQQLAAFRAATPDLHMNLDLDIGGASAGMAAMLAQAVALRTAMNGIDTPSGGGGLGGLPGGGAASAAGGMGSMLPMIGSIAALAPVALGAVGQLGIGMMGLGAAAGPALATVALGFEGIKTAAQSIQPQFDALKTQVSDVFATEMAPAFQSIGTLMESLGPEMEGIASGISGLFTGVTDALTGPGWDSLQELFGSIPTFLSAMGPGLNDMVVGFTDLGLAAAPAMQAIGGGLGDLLGSFGQALTGLMESGDLTTLFEGFGQSLTGIGQLLGPLVTMLGQLGAELGGSLGGLFAQLGDILTQLTPSFREIVSVVGPVLVETFANLTPALAPLGDAFASLVSALAPILPLAAELIGQLVASLAPALAVVFDALAPVIQSLVAQLSPIIQQLAPILADVAMQIGQALATAIQAIAPSLPMIADSFGQIVLAIAPFLPQLAQIGAELLPPLLALFNDLVTTILPPVTTGLTWLAENVLPVVVTAVTDLARSWGEKIQSLRDTFASVKEFLGNAVEGIVGFFQGMGDSIGGVWDSVVDNIRSAVHMIGDLLQKIPTKIGPITVPGAQGARDLGAKLSAWREGGLIAGPGTGISDSILAMVSNGEFIVRAAQVDKPGVRSLLEALNSGWVPPVDMLRALLPGFATGGFVGDAGQRAVDFAQSKNGLPYVYGGSSGDSWDCSGYMSGIHNRLTGQSVRYVTGSDFASLGYEPGYDPNGFSIGTNGGVGENGHMAGTLFGVNVESDGSNGVQYGGGANGANDFPMVWHLPRSLWNPPSLQDPNSESLQGLDYGNDPSQGLDYSGGTSPATATPGIKVPGTGKTSPAPSVGSSPTVAPQSPAKSIAASRGEFLRSNLDGFTDKFTSAGKQALQGWLPYDIFNPGGLLGGLIDSGKFLADWYTNPQNLAESAAYAAELQANPAAALSKIAGGFLGDTMSGGSSMQTPQVDAGTVNQQVQALTHTAPASLAAPATPGDTFQFVVRDVEEGIRKYQQIQARKAAGFISR